MKQSGIEQLYPQPVARLFLIDPVCTFESPFVPPWKPYIFQGIFAQREQLKVLITGTADGGADSGSSYSSSPQRLETTGTPFFIFIFFSERNPFHLVTNLWLTLFTSASQHSVTSALSPSLNIFMPSVSWSHLVKQLQRGLRTINSQLFRTAWDVSHLTQWLVEETGKRLFLGRWSV